MQAGAIGQAGEALVFKMDQPVKIADVPRQLMEQSDTPVRIEHTGLRRGEKLHEELFGDSDPSDIRPEHPMVSHVPAPPLTDIEVTGLPTAGNGRLVKAANGGRLRRGAEPQVRPVETPPSTTFQPNCRPGRWRCRTRVRALPRPRPSPCRTGHPSSKVTSPRTTRLRAFRPARRRFYVSGDHMPPDLQIVAPSFLWGSGGHRTILNNALAVSQRGVRVSLLVEVIQGPDTTLKEQCQIAESLIPTISSALDIKVGWDRVDRSVPIMATAAQTVRALKASRSDRKLYFLQDRESLFNPAGWSHLSAELSFLTEATRLSIGKWIPAFLSREYGVTAIPTPFGVDHNVYVPGLAARSARPRVAVLLQPDKPRRLTELLLDALGHVARRRPDIDIVFFGSDLGIDFDYPSKHLGLLPEASIARLYASSWLGVCLSATNPSRVPFEMVASGIPVLDIFADNTLYDYPHAVRLVYPGEKSLGGAVISMLEEAADHQRVALREAPQLPSRNAETDVFAEIVTSVLDGRPQEFGSPDLPRPTRLDYDLPPHHEEKLMADYWLTRTRNIAVTTEHGSVG